MHGALGGRGDLTSRAQQISQQAVIRTIGKLICDFEVSHDLSQCTCKMGAARPISSIRAPLMKSEELRSSDDAPAPLARAVSDLDQVRELRSSGVITRMHPHIVI